MVRSATLAGVSALALVAGAGTARGQTVINSGDVLEMTASSDFDIAEDVIVGQDVTGGTLRLVGGAISGVTGDVLIGDDMATSVGVIDLLGVGTQFDVSGLLDVGAVGAGTMAVSNGAALTVGGPLRVANGDPAQTSILGIFGGATASANSLGVGLVGEGILSLSSGGTLSIATNADFAGSLASGSAIVDVAGSGTHLDIGGALFMGDWGDATLTITDNARVSISNGFVLMGMGGSTLNITNGGVLETQRFHGQTVATDTIAVDGGTIRVTGTTQSLGDLLGDRYADGDFVIGGNGATIDTDFDVFIRDSVLSGTGALIKTGTGSLTLDGANTYTGGNVVQEGTLVGLMHSLHGDIQNDATLVFDQWNGAYGDTLSGTGTFQKTGAGTLSLTGTNSNTGTWQVFGGTLDGDVDAIQGDVELAGTTLLNINQATDASFAGEVSGDGGFVKAGAGTLTLSGVNSYTGGSTIQAGAVTGTTNSVQGTYQLGAGTILTFDQNFAGNHAGEITGSGQIIKDGSGTVTLTQDSQTFSGDVSVDQGLLAVNRDMQNASALVMSGATLGGSGSLGAVMVGNGATLAPGNSIGTLTVSDMTLDNATFEVELKSGGHVAGVHNDLLNATGAVVINGGTVHVMAENGVDNGATYTPGTYTIITAAGGVTGTFASLVDNYVYLDFALDYAVDSVVLNSNLLVSSFCLVGMTVNQCETGDGAFTVGSGTMFDALVGLTAAEASHALDQLSGEIHVSSAKALVEDTRFARQAALDRLRIALSNPTDMVEAQPGPAVWAQGFGASSQWTGDGNAAGLNRNIGGMFVGGDAQLGEHAVVGLMAGYGRSALNIGDRGSSAVLDSYTLGAYAGNLWDDISLKGGVAQTWHSLATSRVAAFSGFSDNLAASYGARTFQAFVEAAYGTDLGVGHVEPYANLTYINHSADGFSEQGGAASLYSSGQSTAAAVTTVGIRGEFPVDLGEKEATLSGGVGWRHTFGDAPTATHGFAAGGNSFTVTGVPLAQDTLVLDAGVRVDLSDSASLGLTYDGQIGAGVADHGAQLSLIVRF